MGVPLTHSAELEELPVQGTVLRLEDTDGKQGTNGRLGAPG